MKLKRLVTSLNASFEGFVSGVENHDAVAQSAINDVRKVAAKLRVQQGQLAGRARRLVEAEQALTRKRDRWQTRAQDFAEHDPEQALQCLRNRDSVDQQLAQTNEQLTQQRSLCEQLAGNLAQVEQRLSDLQHKRIALSSREARTSVLAKTAGLETQSNIDEMFERWEVAVLQGEYREGDVLDGSCDAKVDEMTTGSVDQLDNLLQREERDRQLRAELERLRGDPSR